MRLKNINMIIALCIANLVEYYNDLVRSTWVIDLNISKYDNVPKEIRCKCNFPPSRMNKLTTTKKRFSSIPTLEWCMLCDYCSPI